MTPDKPQTPSQGTPDDDKIREDAQEAKQATAEETAAQPEAKPKRTRKKAEPQAEGDDAPAPAEETAEPAAVEASAEDDEPTPPAKKPRARKKADEKPAEAAKDDKPAKPARKRDQPRQRQPGEAPVLVSAKARYVRTSARKARLVCDHIRGKDVEQARAILSFTPRGAAKPWMKLLESAIANAEHNHELVGDELKIASVHADEGPTLKRYRPRAMGRATRIRKRTSHLSITLTPKE